MEHSLNKKTQLNWFISAGIVGADIGTSVFYSTGILFPIVGYFAPAFVLFTCLAMWIFKKTYEEGLAMSPRNGGAYSMILRSAGRRPAVAAGALTFVSYLATAAVSSLSGSYYICSLFSNQPSLILIVAIAFIPLIFFSLMNIRGLTEPAKIVTVIASFHFIFLFVIGIWGLTYIGLNWETLNLSKFLNLAGSGNFKISLPLIAYGFAASFLGITGFESAAQIIESLKKPHMKTLEKLYTAVILAVSCTAPLISFVCLATLTSEEINGNLNSLLSAMTFKIGGSLLKTLLVVNASLTLFAATNTALVGFVGLATTMAKNGNLPQILLTRWIHKNPKLEGYPYISIPFAFITMIMAALVAGEVKTAGKVYGIAFLGVMVCFSLGAILMRNKGFNKSTPLKYLSQKVLIFKNQIYSLPPLITLLILGVAFFILIFQSDFQVLFMLTLLLSITSLLMAYYRWTILEKRLVSHSDLRLGFGSYAKQTTSDLPHDLPTYVLCIGTANTRRLIMSALKRVKSIEKDRPYELILFYAEGEDIEDSSIFYELLQRIVSQQIAPMIKQNIILTVKILPGTLLEGLNVLQANFPFRQIFFGSSGHDPIHAHTLKDTISKELDVSIISLDPH